MPLQLQLRQPLRFPVDLRQVTRDAVRGKSADDVSRLPVQMGGERMALGETFRVTGRDDGRMEWIGDLSHARFLAADWTEGEMVVEGPVGAYAGWRMTGGQIEIQGDAADYAGAEMTGGSLRVLGSVGNGAGGALPGSRLGMNGGFLSVAGAAGAETGFRMRRGLLVVDGPVGRLAGWQMRAGTLLALGGATSGLGWEMVRGTILVAGSAPAPVAPAFAPSFQGRPEVLGLLRTYLRQQGIPQASLERLDGEFESYVGDRQKGGRGEIFLDAAGESV